MKRLLSFLLMLLSFVSMAQSDYVVVNDIVIEGNSVTKSSVILKELTFAVGDTICVSSLEDELRLSKENLQNTTLFNFVDFECIDDVTSENSIILNIKLTERWYLWMYPYVAYADRNVNAWYEADDIRRFSYGADLEYKNVWGLKHNMMLTLISGYNQNYGFSYDIPYLIDKYNVGIKSGVAYKRDKEVAYLTEANKISYFNGGDEYAKQSFDIFVEPYYRFGHRNRLFLRFEYSDTRFSEALTFLNDDFVNEKGTQFQYFTLSATYKNDFSDEQNYPLKGHYL